MSNSHDDGSDGIIPEDIQSAAAVSLTFERISRAMERIARPTYRGYQQGIDPAYRGYDTAQSVWYSFSRQRDDGTNMMTCPCAGCKAAREHVARLQAGNSTMTMSEADVPYLERGEIVEVDWAGDPDHGVPGDPNHGRAGPVWSDVADKDDKVEVWFEDGIQEYRQDQVKTTGEFWDGEQMDKLPENPGAKSGAKMTLTPSVVSMAQEVRYEHPYRIHPKNY